MLEFGLGIRLKLSERECASYDHNTANVARDSVFETNHDGQEEWERGGKVKFQVGC